MLHRRGRCAGSRPTGTLEKSVVRGDVMLVDIVAGYLGSGKTTLMGRLIESDPEPQRLVALVNEFGELGIDGLLVAGATDVVELSSGCICCTLRLDFRTQIIEIARERDPRRLLIEPTGVATVGQVIKALNHPDLAPIVQGVRVFTLVDATTFNERLRESPRFFASQVEAADLVVLNKVDLVEDRMIPVLRAAVESIAPDAWVVSTVRGELPEDLELPPYHPAKDAPESEVLEGLTSVSYGLPGAVPAAAMRRLFEELRTGEFGQVERAKALADTDEGWKRFDLSGRTYEEQPAGPVPEGRMVVIGRDLDRPKLDEAVSMIAAEPSTSRQSTAE